MRTQDLIDALARDAKSERRGVRQSLGIGLAAGIAASVPLFLWLLGPRADFAQAIATPWYPAKIAILAGLAMLAIPVAEALARPGARVQGWLLLLPAGLLALAVLADLAMLGLPGAAMRLQGKNGLDCIALIPLFSAAPLMATLIALRGGAAPSATRAGLAAGLLSGAIGGVLYGLYCPDDSPLFVVVWYSIGIGIVAGTGALVGRAMLRW